MTRHLTGLPDALWRTPGRQHFTACLNPATRAMNHQLQPEGALAAHGLPDGENQFFACAEFVGHLRRREFAAGAYGLWLDIDCGEGKFEAGKGYADVGAATQAIGRFLRDSGLPAPTHVVHSGGGLHLYWILTEFVPRDAWQVHASGLKEITRKHGLLADPTRTADITSLMRLPGSLNHKFDPPRQVVLVHAGEWLDASVFLELLSPQASAPALEHCEAAPSSREVRRADDSERAPLTFDELEWLLRYIPPDVDYAEWVACLMALHQETAGSPEGLALAIRWSSGGRKFKGAGDITYRWNRFRLDLNAPVAAGTLVWLAQSHEEARRAAA